MNISSISNVAEFAPVLTSETQQPTIAVGEPHPSHPPMTADTIAAINASYGFLAGQMNMLDAKQAESSFRVLNYQTDELGMTHVRMQQLENGVPVYGQQVITHVKDGKVQSMTGEYQKDLFSISKKVKPLVSERAALRNVRNNYHASISSPSTELLFYPTEKQGTRLAYKIEFFDANRPARMTYFVDARNGRILNKINALATYAAPASAAAPHAGFFRKLDSSLRQMPTRARNFVQATQQTNN